MSAVVAHVPGRQRKVRRKRKPVTCLRCGWTWVPYGRAMPRGARIKPVARPTGTRRDGSALRRGSHDDPDL